MREAIPFEGIGLHTGEISRIVLKPNNSEGYIFRFMSKSFNLRQAIFNGDGRGTMLSFPEGLKLGTVEHLLGALRGCGVDDVEIIIEKGTEIPSLDGSGKSFAEAFYSIGIIEKQEYVKPLTLSFPVGVDMENQRCSIFAFPASCFKVTYIIEYDNQMIGMQMKSIKITPESFLSEIASARTFALEKDLDNLRDRGLARGGDLSNAILVREREVNTEGGLRFRDEFVRHKILDLVGDMALLDIEPCFHVFCIKGGHSIHLKLVEKLNRIKGTNIGKGVTLSGIRHT